MTVNKKKKEEEKKRVTRTGHETVAMTICLAGNPYILYSRTIVYLTGGGDDDDDDPTEDRPGGAPAEVVDVFSGAGHSFFSRAGTFCI